MRNQTDFYKEYLRSFEWQLKREQALVLAGHSCQKCGVPDNVKQLEVHHKTYTRLGKELPEDLQVLCKDCHKAADNSRAYSTALNTYATKVYGDDWQDNFEDAIEDFDNWREEKSQSDGKYY